VRRINEKSKGMYLVLKNGTISAINPFGHFYSNYNLVTDVSMCLFDTKIVDIRGKSKIDSNIQTKHT
jgi:hypothetical protein